MFLEEKIEPRPVPSREAELARFLAFVESKPPWKGYCYISSATCAIAQFTGKILFPKEIKERFGEAAHAVIRDSHTFGELARRLHEI